MTARSGTWKPAILLLLLIVLVGVALPLFVTPDHLKALFLEQIEYNLGRKIEVGHVRLVVFPSIRLELSRVVIRDLDPAKVFLRAKRLDLVLRAMPLLRGEVVGKRLTIEDLRAELRRDRDGRWNFLSGPPIAGQALERAVGNPLVRLLAIRQTRLMNGGLTIVDEFRPDGVRTLQLDALDAAMSVRPDGRHATLTLSATVPGEHGVSALSLAGNLTRVESPLGVETGALLPGLAFQFEGEADAANLHLRQMADFFGPRPVPERVGGAASLRGHVKLVPGVAGYDMVLSSMAAKVEHLSITGQASLSGLMTDQPTFALTFSASPVSLEELLDRFPAHWIHPRLQAVIVERGIEGMVEVATATVTGSTLPEPRFSLTGEFRVQQGRALVGRDRTPAEHLSGTVFVEPGRIRVADLTGIYGTLRIRKGQALVSFLEAGPVLELEVSGDQSASDVAAALSRRIGTERLSGILSRVREVTGDALVTFRVTDYLDQATRPATVGGEIVARDWSFLSPEIPERVVGLSGRLVFSQGLVEFDRVSWRLGQSQFHLQGAVSIGETSMFREITVRAKVEAPHVVRLVRGGILSDKTLRGSIAVTASLSGPTDAPHVKGALDLKDAVLTVPGFLEKPAAAPASFQFEGDLSRDRVFSFSQAEMLLPPLRLAGKGKLRLGTAFSIEAALASGPIALAGVPTWLSLGGIKAGALEVLLDVKGKGRDWKAWKVKGWVALTDGIASIQGTDQTVTGLYLRLKLLNNGADVKRLAFRISGSDVRVSGTIRNWHRTPSVNLKVESPHFDVALLTPKGERSGERSSLRDLLEGLAATSRVVATVDVEQGVYKQLTLTDLSWRVNLGEGILDLDRIRGLSDGGRLSGRVVVRLPQKKPADVEMFLRVAGLPFQQLATLFGAEEQPIVGELALTGTIQGNGRNPRGVSRTLGGKVDLAIERGRLLKFTAVSKILSILNLPTLLSGQVDLVNEGMPFDKITATFTVRNGLVTTENLLIDSPVMKISGAGNYDLVTDQLDFVMAASPFGSYSKFLKSIPLFGKLFAGERKGIDTALFEVKGSLKDPKVEYLSVRSFATGLTGLAQFAFDVLKNVVMLPKELIAPSDQAQPPPETDQAPSTQEPDRTPEPATSGSP